MIWGVACKSRDRRVWLASHVITWCVSCDHVIPVGVCMLCVKVCVSLSCLVTYSRQIVLTFKVSVMATIHFVQSEKLGGAWEQG